MGFFDRDDDECSTGSMIFGPKMGTWTVHSDKDPRWNASGRATGLVCDGGPKAMKDWVKSCKEKYGDAPKDLIGSFWKD